MDSLRQRNVGSFEFRTEIDDASGVSLAALTNIALSRANTALRCNGFKADIASFDFQLSLFDDSVTAIVRGITKNALLAD